MTTMPDENLELSPTSSNLPVTKHATAVRAKTKESPKAGRLPERYNIPLFELLVVDSEYVFLSWEITNEQLGQARQTMGNTDFAMRWLIVRFTALENQPRHIRDYALYGDIGRWFVRLQSPGAKVSGELAFRCRNKYYRLAKTGPVYLPRIHAVEPKSYQEMHVRYVSGPLAELRIEKYERLEPARRPDVSIPLPESITSRTSLGYPDLPSSHLRPPQAPIGTSQFEDTT